MEMSTNLSSASHKALASLLINHHRENKNNIYASSLNEYSNKFEENSKIFNQRLVNLSNLPPTSCQRNNRHSISYIRACQGMCQNMAQSLDLLRQIVQSSINEEINKIIQKYINVYFVPAKANINANNNENGEVNQEHMHHVCCQILEEAKKMYVISPVKNSLDMFSMMVSTDGMRDTSHEFECIRPRKRKRTFSSGSDSKLPLLSKKIKNVTTHYKAYSGRSTPNKTKHVETVKKEGMKWDPKRLTEETEFIMGSKANKALGLGATRGRLYIKHPDLFKYGGDQDDKQWLFENIHMPATGGRTYLLILDDIKELAHTDEYRNGPGLALNELVGFTVPHWMIQKMQILMNSQRTDKNIYDSFKGSSDCDSSKNEQDDELSSTNAINDNIHNESFKDNSFCSDIGNIDDDDCENRLTYFTEH